MVLGNWLVLKRLRQAIQKVRFLLSFHVHKWRLPQMIRSSSSQRQLSFNDPPGLMDFISEVESEDSGIGSSPIQRTRSDASADDIDKRADIFIANFYKHIQMERQVSLQLRYTNGGGLERTRSD